MDPLVNVSDLKDNRGQDYLRVISNKRFYAGSVLRAVMEDVIQNETSMNLTIRLLLLCIRCFQFEKNVLHVFSQRINAHSKMSYGSLEKC